MGVSTDCVIGVASGTSTTSATTKAFNIDMAGIAPKAILVVASLAVTNETVADGLSLSIGIASASNAYAFGMWAENATGTSNAGRHNKKGPVVYLTDATGTLICEATVDSFSADEIVLDFTTAPATAVHLSFWAVGGNTASVYVGDATTPSTSTNSTDVTDPGFNPKGLLTLTDGLNIDASGSPAVTTGDDAGMAMGMASWDGSTLAMRSNVWNHRDGFTTSITLFGRFTDKMGLYARGSGVGTAEVPSEFDVHSFDSSGFSVRTINIDRASRLAYLAFDPGTTDVKVQVGTFATGNTTGNVSESGVAFGTGSLLFMLSEVNTGTGYVFNSPGNTWGLGASAGQDGDPSSIQEWSHNGGAEDAKTTGNTFSWFSNAYSGWLIGRDQSITNCMKASMVSFDDDGFTLDFDLERGGAKDWYYMAVQRAATTAAPAIQTIEFEAQPVGIPTTIITQENAIELDAIEPSVSTPVAVGPESIEVEDQPISPTTPVAPSIGTLSIGDLGPAPTSPIPLEAAILEISDATPSVATPIPVGPYDLEIESVAPVVVTPVALGVYAVEFADIAATIATGASIAVPRADLEIESITPLVTTPVVLDLSGLVVEDQPVTISTPTDTNVVLPVSVLEMGLVAAPAVIVPGCYEYLHNVVRSRVRSIVETGQSLPVLFDNEPQVDAAGVQVISTIDHISQTKLHVGQLTHVYRKLAHLVLSFTAPIEDGDPGMLSVIDAVLPSFRTITDTGVAWATPYVEPAWRIGDRWVIRLNCPFHFDDAAIPTVVQSGAPLVTDFETMANVVRSRFKTQVEDTVLSGKVLYDNAPFDPPQHDTWASFTMNFGETTQVQGGIAKTYRTSGTCQVMIFSPIEDGDQAGLSIADTINESFRSVTDSGVTFRTPFVRTVGRAGPWWQVNVILPFYSDEVA